MPRIQEGLPGAHTKAMMRILQLNLNHCVAAQDLLMQTVREEHIDVAIIAEQYKDLRGPCWKADASGSAAVWVCGEYPFQEVMRSQENAFVRAKVNGVHLYSCYMPPSMTQEDFEAVLDRLVADAKDRSPVAIAGDFNAWAVEWGSERTNKRGQALLEAFSVLNLQLLNDGKLPTFVKGEARSMIDLTFLSSGLVIDNADWLVRDIYTHSDHRAITWIAARHKSCEEQPPRTNSSRGWKVSAFDAGTLRAFIEGYSACGSTAEEKVHDVMGKVVGACDAAMPRRGSRHPHKSVYWWNENISQLRQECNRARRLAQRARKKPTFPNLEAAYKLARSKLTTAIKCSKKQCWAELIDEVDNDPWGKPYKVVMTKLKGQARQQPTCPEQLKKIVAVLFPKQETFHYHVNQDQDQNIPTITREELLQVCNKVGNTKAPGLDQIPNIALKTAIKAAPDLFLDMYNTCLAEGIFPERWKRQRLVLLPKGNKPPDEPSAYRPLCMLDTAGKILERFIHDRIEAVIGQSLAENQYGFRKGRSTIDAINHVISTAKDAIRGTRWKRGSKKYCLLAALDVKNAFNSARWSNICLALDKLKVPAYLRKMIMSYFNGRELIYETEKGQQYYRVTGGVPQGSVLGPLLWNVMYDDLLKTKLPLGAEMVAFADDAGLLIVGKFLEEISRVFEDSYNIVQRFMGTVGLELADHKTEAVLFTSRKEMETIVLDVGDSTITSRSHIRYLGVMLDARLNFKQHVKHATEKAARTAMTLARLMPNIGGPRQSRRKLLASVANSVLTYGITMWGDALKNCECRRKVTAVHRLSALRVCCAFRTVSNDAVCVVAGMMPMDVLAEERKRLYETKSTVPEQQREQKKIEEKRSLQRWQRKWDASAKGRWTYRLIPQVEHWVNRKHGETNYYLTQMLTGHGCFKAYLHRFGHGESAECATGCGVPEDAEHVFFQCPKFQQERAAVNDYLKTSLTPETLVRHMMTSEQNWGVVSSYATTILKKLRKEEQERRMAAE